MDYVDDDCKFFRRAIILYNYTPVHLFFSLFFIFFVSVKRHLILDFLTVRSRLVMQSETTQRGCISCCRVTRNVASHRFVLGRL